jgi:hypothetical protein
VQSDSFDTMVQSREKADLLLNRIVKEELFGSGIREKPAGSVMPFEAFEERVDPAQIHPKIAVVLMKQNFFGVPVNCRTTNTTLLNVSYP